MRRLYSRVAALAALLVLALPAIAAAAPVVFQGGNLVLTLDGDVFPVALPEGRPEPITLTMSAKVGTLDGSQPPASREVVLETAKDGYLDAEGLPACGYGRLAGADTHVAERNCHGAIVGRGNTTVSVAFPESTPFQARGKVVAFNGGIKNGVTTLYLHAFVAVPSPTAVITTVRIKKINNGPYGLRSVARVPAIAGGAGSLTSFDLTLHRLFRYHDAQHSYLEGECHHDKQLARIRAIFSDGERISGSLVRPCLVKH